MKKAVFIDGKNQVLPPEFAKALKLKYNKKRWLYGKQ